MPEILRELIRYPNEYHLYQTDSHFYMTGKARLRDSSNFLDLDIPQNGERLDWGPSAVNDELWQILTPRDGRIGNVEFGHTNQWRLVTVFNTVRGGHITYKVALVHRQLNKVLLYTVCNFAEAVEAKVPSSRDGWFVLQCDMIASAAFWADLKARL